MKLTAVCISTKAENWTYGTPFYCHVADDKPHPRTRSRERVLHLAKRRNEAVTEALRRFPETTHILMIDSYYLGQLNLDRLLADYKDEDSILGASTWTHSRSTLNPKTVFWDSWTTPEATYCLPTQQGIVKVQSVGACCIFPVNAWKESGGYDAPDFGTEHMWLCQRSGRPVYLDFDVKLFHPPHQNYGIVRRVRNTLKDAARPLWPSQFVTIRRDGHRWCFGGVEDAGLGYSDHERWLRDRISDRMKGHMFVDVGAHVGGWVVRFARTFESILAVEPNPRTVRVLWRNIRLNNLEKKTSIFCGALSDYEGRAGLNRYQTDGWNSMLNLHRAPTLPARLLSEIVPVTVRSLDSLHISPTVVKVDTEGSESRILEGARETLSKHHPYLIIETHSEDQLDKVIQSLEEHSYNITRLMAPGQTYLLAE